LFSLCLKEEIKIDYQKQTKRQKTVGLSFAGGGVQSWAEVAAYADLERQGIEIDAVTGTSMGSFLAAAVASGLSSDEVYEVIYATDQAINESSLFGPQAVLSLFSLRKPMGLVLVDKLAEVIRPVSKLYGEVMLSDIPKPLAIPAVDIISNQLIIFSNQPEYFRPVYKNAKFYEEDIPLVQACLASSAYPIILSPVKIDDYQLVDGGLMMNSPAALFSKEKIEHVVAIRIPMLEKTGPLDKRLDIALRSIRIMVKNQEEILAKNVDLNYFLDVKLPGLFEFGDSKPIIQAGIDYVKDHPLDTSNIFEEIAPKREEDEKKDSASSVEIIIEKPVTIKDQMIDLWNRMKAKI